MATPSTEILNHLKFNLKESQYPYFSDDDLIIILNDTAATNDEGDIVYDLDAASYRGLRIKAEDDSIKLSGLDIPSSQKHFLDLAKMFRKNQNMVL